MIIGEVLPYFNEKVRLWPYVNQAENRNFPTFSKKKPLAENFMNICPTC
jgi:hypothetical protein